MSKKTVKPCKAPKGLWREIPGFTREVLKEHGTTLANANYPDCEKPEYTKLKFKRIYKGYDFLEHFAFVRSHIMRKYKLKHFTPIEIMFYLVPRNIFMFQDFKDVQRLRFTYRKIDSLIELGLISIVNRGKNRTHHIYAPTKKARKMIQETYEMLAGEIPIPTDLLNESPVASDRWKAEIIKKINKKEVSKSKRAIWKK